MKKSTGIARKMVCEWGMSEKLGPLSYGAKEEEIFLGREITKHKDYSDQTAQLIDDEIKLIINTCMLRADKILADNIEVLHKLSLELLEREILDSEEIDKIIRGEELPPVKKVNNNSTKISDSDTEIPDHVKKLLDKKKGKHEGTTNETVNDAS